MPSQQLPPEVQAEAGMLVKGLCKAGWRIVLAVYDKNCFGNWYVDLTRNDKSIRLVKDRSQYMIDAPAEEKKPAGLYKAFNDLEEFRKAVIASMTFGREHT